MDILLWHKILSPYELAVKELVLKFSHMKKEHRERGDLLPDRTCQRPGENHFQYSGKNAEERNIRLERMEELVEDIAGIRIICQFVEDIEQGGGAHPKHVLI